MAYINLFFVAFLTIIGQFAFADNYERIGTTNVKVIDDIGNYLDENPDVKIVQLQRAAGAVRRNHYTLGYRVPGDRIVAQGNNNFVYRTPQDVQQRVWYPTSGAGAIVSYVDIWVDQNSQFGNAYVVSGGIGQRSISLVLEAKGTTQFNYRVAIYGY